MNKLSILFAGVLLVSSANAQPFGIEMGTAIGDLSVREEMEPFLFEVNPPREHPEVETYVIRATPKQGVCQINAIGKDHQNDRYGRSVQVAFNTLRKQLDDNYGTSGFVDFLQSGALWRDSNEWVMSIMQNERTYQSAWDREEGSKLGHNVESIIMSVRATSSSSSWINLQYRFSNYEACKREMDAARGDAL